MCACVHVCVCLPLSTSFTTQLIRLAALGNSAMLIQGPHSQSSLAHACPKLPFISRQIKCTQKGFLSLEDIILTPCPTHIQMLPSHLSSSSNWARGMGPPENGGKGLSLHPKHKRSHFQQHCQPGSLLQLAAVLRKGVSKMHPAEELWVSHRLPLAFISVSVEWGV